MVNGVWNDQASGSGKALPAWITIDKAPFRETGVVRPESTILFPQPLVTLDDPHFIVAPWVLADQALRADVANPRIAAIESNHVIGELIS
jgi:hypothetical protein